MARAKAAPTTSAMVALHGATTNPFWKPARKSGYATALRNQCKDRVCGGNDRIALSLNAAIATTTAGRTTKMSNTRTTNVPMTPSNRCHGERGILVRPDVFKRPHRDSQERQDCNCKD